MLVVLSIFLIAFSSGSNLEDSINLNKSTSSNKTLKKTKAPQALLEMSDVRSHLHKNNQGVLSDIQMICPDSASNKNVEMLNGVWSEWLAWSTCSALPIIPLVHARQRTRHCISSKNITVKSISIEQNDEIILPCVNKNQRVECNGAFLEYSLCLSNNQGKESINFTHTALRLPILGTSMWTPEEEGQEELPRSIHIGHQLIRKNTSGIIREIDDIISPKAFSSQIGSSINSLSPNAIKISRVSAYPAILSQPIFDVQKQSQSKIPFYGSTSTFSSAPAANSAIVMPISKLSSAPPLTEISKFVPERSSKSTIQSIPYTSVDQTNIIPSTTKTILSTNKLLTSMLPKIDFSEHTLDKVKLVTPISLSRNSLVKIPTNAPQIEIPVTTSTETANILSPSFILMNTPSKTTVTTNMTNILKISSATTKTPPKSVATLNFSQTEMSASSKPESNEIIPVATLQSSTTPLIQPMTNLLITGNAPVASVPPSIPPFDPSLCSMTSWSDWQIWSSCSDICGGCGTRQRFRSCENISLQCICPGKAFERQPCNLNVCIYPRQSPCCGGRRLASANNQFVCV